jgi:uncharacterized protein (UPF0210 family)
MLIEDWQADLRKVTLRITWDDVVSGERKTYERNIYLHRDRTTMMIFSVAEEVV